MHTVVNVLKIAALEDLAAQATRLFRDFVARFQGGDDSIQPVCRNQRRCYGGPNRHSDRVNASGVVTETILAALSGLAPDRLGRDLSDGGILGRDLRPLLILIVSVVGSPERETVATGAVTSRAESP
ncbi:hypothetical protein WN48_00382 [Eufriesea mexicana]|uniref:Uncharacterized protein n=1 Tax=Eufriesea mexicana TaxID=516756 RepID=A0A310SGZ7_9HYME|nr:hypothetical protein WN48_00382 [Eufriesea mexicana]